MNPVISIIVPVYNVEKYLDRCLKSLVSQSLKNIEIILVDDGSPDECPVLCDHYAASDNRIKVIHKKNAGLGMARNSGLDVAIGDYVAFVDSDDFVELNMYEMLYYVAINEHADAVISGGFIDERSDGTTYTNHIMKTVDVFDGNTKQLALEMLGANPEFRRDYTYEPSVCKGVYRRSVIINNQIRFHSEREIISEDYVFHLDLFQVTKKAVCVPDCYYHYCQNGVSLTKTYHEDRFRRNIEFYEYITKRLMELKYSPKDMQYADRMLLARARVAVSQISAHYRWNDCHLKQEILAICNENILKRILENYPIQKLPFKHRVFVLGMKTKSWKFLYFLSRLNNGRK